MSKPSGTQRHSRRKRRKGKLLDWVPPGLPVTIQGYRLTDGMVFLGVSRESAAWGLPKPHELVSIDPSLPVVRPPIGPRASDSRSWLPYARLSPQDRGRYLAWLACGRREPEAPLGLVRRFLAGLERRLLVFHRTPPPRSEIDALLAEIERLREIYGSRESFHADATSLLNAARLRHGRLDELEIVEPPVQSWSPHWMREMPLGLKIALGRCAVEQRPIPAQWALCWLLDSWTVLPTVADRCPHEFRELFRRRYADHFPDGGLRIPANSRRLEAWYGLGERGTFGSRMRIPLPEDLPDVTVQGAPLERLRQFAVEVCQELAAFSRWVGRSRDREHPAALALLPPDLQPAFDTARAKRITAWLESFLGPDGQGVFPPAELLARWQTQNPGRLTAREAEALFGFFAVRGLGIEPDVRVGGFPLHRTDAAVVFRRPPEASAAEAGGMPRDEAILLRLAALVIDAGGGSDGLAADTIRRSLRGAHDCPLAEARAGATWTWLLLNPPRLQGLRKELHVWPEPTRRRTADLLLQLAAADGHVSPEEIKILTKIYGLLGLDGSSVYGDVHALMSGEAAPQSAAAPAAEHAAPVTSPASGFDLDLDKIRRKREETRRVSALLGDIFVEEDDEPEPVPSSPEGDGETIGGLDGAHSKLLRHLAARGTWSRAEIERLAGELGLLPDGALETLNEEAFSRCDAPLFEGDDPIEIDPDVLQEMAPDESLRSRPPCPPSPHAADRDHPREEPT